MTRDEEIKLFKKLDKIDLNMNNTDTQIQTMINIFKELNIDKRFQHLEDKILELESRLIVLERNKDG